MQRIGIFFVNGQNVVYLEYWFFIGEIMIVFNNTNILPGQVKKTPANNNLKFYEMSTKEYFGNDW